MGLALIRSIFSHSPVSMKMLELINYTYKVERIKDLVRQ